MDDRNLTFGAWLRGRRAELAQTITEASTTCEVSDKTWSAWERETGAPVKVGDVRKIAAWAGVEALSLFALMVGDPRVETEPKTTATG